MAAWREVSAGAPEAARVVRATFAVRKHATMASIQRDGTPRISGTEVDFAEDGEIYLGMMSGTKRADDLRRDPRVSVHCPTEDPPEDDAARWLGDGKITARAVEVSPDLFRMDITRAVLTRVVGDELEISVWRPTGGVEVIRRD